MQDVVAVKGLRDLQRALKETDADVAKGMDKELRSAAKLVADDARSRLASLSEYSARGIRPRIRGFGHVAAEQSRRKTTGQHPEWGQVVMRQALIPARTAKVDQVIERLENMLDRVGRKEF